eukprot:Hpha_TRINITY_DN15541_c3_g2::TRINITY_DN15541_c3_g2_i1::g.109101::m.109101
MSEMQQKYRKVGVDRAGIAQMREAILRSRGLQRRLGKMRVGVVARHLSATMAAKTQRVGKYAFWCEACGKGFVHDFNRRQHLLACGGGGGCARLKSQGLYVRVAQSSVDVTKQGYRALAGGIDVDYRHAARLCGRALRARGLLKSNKMALRRRVRGGEVLAVTDAVAAGAARLQIDKIGGAMRWREVAVESRAGFHTAWGRDSLDAAALASGSGACCVAFGERLTPWVPPRVPGR